MYAIVCPVLPPALLSSSFKLLSVVVVSGLGILTAPRILVVRSTRLVFFSVGVTVLIVVLIALPKDFIELALFLAVSACCRDGGGLTLLLILG